MAGTVKRTLQNLNRRLYPATLQQDSTCTAPDLQYSLSTAIVGGGDCVQHWPAGRWFGISLGCIGCGWFASQHPAHPCTHSLHKSFLAPLLQAEKIKEIREKTGNGKKLVGVKKHTSPGLLKNNDHISIYFWQNFLERMSQIFNCETDAVDITSFAWGWHTQVRWTYCVSCYIIS